jgi:putative endonuclease
VLARNVRTPGGEVDVLALDGETVVLVEVKATARTGPGRPLDRVDHRKRERLRAAWAWLAASKGLSGRPHRFDVVEVATGPGERRCEVRRGAFRG